MLPTGDQDSPVHRAASMAGESRMRAISVADSQRQETTLQPEEIIYTCIHIYTYLYLYLYELYEHQSKLL